MKLILCTNRAGWLLRFVMWSRWSHSAILDEATGMVYDSTLLGGGVCVGPMGEFMQHYRRHELRDIDVRVGRLEESRAWLRAQVGKPYDWTAALGLGLHRNWQKDAAWFCSELVAWAYDRIERPLFRADSMHRVTPQHLFMLQANLLGQRQWP